MMRRFLGNKFRPLAAATLLAVGALAGSVAFAADGAAGGAARRGSADAVLAQA